MCMQPEERRTCDDALHQLVECINATGGCVRLESGHVVPQADQDWIDLGEAYLTACAAMGVEPKVRDAVG